MKPTLSYIQPTFYPPVVSLWPRPMLKTTVEEKSISKAPLWSLRSPLDGFACSKHDWSSAAALAALAVAAKNSSFGNAMDDAKVSTSSRWFSRLEVAEAVVFHKEL